MLRKNANKNFIFEDMH